MTEFKQGLRQISAQAEGLAAIGKDSVLITRDQWLQWALEDRMQYVQQGNAGTKLAFVETAYDEDQPQFALLIPSGVMVIPKNFAITLEDRVGTENHVIWSTASNDIGLGASTALTIERVNPGGQHSSNCRAQSLYTGNAVAAENLHEVKRWVRPFAAALVTDTDLPEDYVWDIAREGPIVLRGPATVQCHIYATTTDPEGFGEYVWAEFEAGAHPG